MLICSSLKPEVYCRDKTRVAQRSYTDVACTREGLSSDAESLEAGVLWYQLFFALARLLVGSQRLRIATGRPRAGHVWSNFYGCSRPTPHWGVPLK